MTHIAEDAAAENGLPQFWEALRTFSGLLAVAAVGLIVLATTVLGSDGSPARVTLATQPEPALPAPAAGPDGASMAESPTSTRLFVFYLVATGEQASAADWGEQVGTRDTSSAGDVDRSYEILFARDEAEVEHAAANILDRVAQYERVAQIQVIDLRNVGASP